MITKQRVNLIAQVVVVLLGALLLKQFYSTAGPNQLRWILAPTTFMVELVSGRTFEFESHAGYMSSDHTFLIAASCAGVNFLLTAFLMLSLRKLWRDRSRVVSWGLIPAVAVCAYLTTIVANTARIALALKLRELAFEVSWLSANQLHRFEGIFVYFGFLLLLFIVSEKLGSESAATLLQPRRLLRLSFFPLLIYYATMVGIPVVNGAFRGAGFWEHTLFVVLVPLPLLLVGFTVMLLRTRRVIAAAEVGK